MPIDITDIWIFRIVAIQNLERILSEGVYCKRKSPVDKTYVAIGSKEIISQRDRATVKCYPEDVVNDYVPFYFSVRTPMLYNIITGHSVPVFPQKDIVYLCYKLEDLATDTFQWCYTDGNAAKAITKFFRNLKNIDKKIDWRSIRTTDFRDNNTDGDEDRIRKKHAEFLVKNHVPPELLHGIVVLNNEKEREVGALLSKLKISKKVAVNPGDKYYFL